mgnify:CR=1 FL=1
MLKKRIILLTLILVLLSFSIGYYLAYAQSTSIQKSLLNKYTGIGEYSVVVFNDGDYTIAVEGSDLDGDGVLGEIIASSTDPTTVIQTAINNVQEGSTIFIKTGIYNLTTTLTSTKNVFLKGEGRGTQLKPTGAFDAVDLTNIQAIDLIYYDSNGVAYDATFDPSTFEDILSKKIETKIKQFKDGTVIVNQRFFYKIYEGYGFSISHRFESVSSDASVDIYFENPSGSGRTVYIVMIEVVSFAQAHIDIYRNSTVTSSGTSITPVNLNFSSTITSVANVEYGGTYTLGTLTLNTVCPGGRAIRAVGGASEVGETVIIPPGYNFLIRVTNKSTSSADLSIRIIWWEEPNT